MGGGGIVGDIVEIGTGGIVKSGKTKDKIAEAEKAAADQKKLLDDQKAELDAEEAERKDRMLRARQGRRSLLYKDGDESGVAQSATLGG